jgi:BirA family biotin operon repressor/biotin-[acetyl-CoA-carboxylase] ligase
MGARPSVSESAHAQWHAEALWRQLEPVLRGLSVEVVARAESTNTLLLERARHTGGRRSGDRQPCLLVAEHQTRGRGRLGRDWLAERGSSLTFSLALVLQPPSWSGLSLAVGVALADALDPPAGGGRPRIGLKWPNDLWLWEAPGRGRKLGGVLIETVQVGHERMAVIGVGLNLRKLPAVDLSQGYASLDEIDDGAEGPRVLARVAPPLVAALQRFERDGLAPCLPAYARRDVLAGQAVATLGGGAGLAGTAEGIDAAGALLVRDGQGLHAVTSGEVSVRLQDTPGC